MHTPMRNAFNFQDHFQDWKNPIYFSYLYSKQKTWADIQHLIRYQLLSFFFSLSLSLFLQPECQMNVCAFPITHFSQIGSQFCFWVTLLLMTVIKIDSNKNVMPRGETMTGEAKKVYLFLYTVQYARTRLGLQFIYKIWKHLWHL